MIASTEDFLFEVVGKDGIFAWIAALPRDQEIIGPNGQWLGLLRFDGESTINKLRNLAKRAKSKISPKDEAKLKLLAGATVETTTGRGGSDVKLFKTDDDLQEAWLKIWTRYPWAVMKKTKPIEMMKDFARAMRDHRTVRVHYLRQRDEGVGFYELEPYSFREGVRKFYGWDVDDQHTKSLFLRRVLGVAQTRHKFVPKWDVEVTVRESLKIDPDMVMLMESYNSGGLMLMCCVPVGVRFDE